jgi:hypothetical protein
MEAKSKANKERKIFVCQNNTTWKNKYFQCPILSIMALTTFKASSMVQKIKVPVRQILIFQMVG